MPDFLAEVLTWPKNHAFALAVQTAMDLCLPPTVMFVKGRQPSEGWSEADKKLAMAWTILQRETCRECGQPLWVCRSGNQNLYFSVRTDVCYAKAELDKWQNSARGKKLKPGEHPYIVPKMGNDEQAPLPSRQEYFSGLTE